MKLSHRTREIATFICGLTTMFSTVVCHASEAARRVPSGRNSAAIVDVSLQDGNRLAGQIVDSQGIAIPGACVYLSRDGKVCHIADSDAAGNFVMAGVEPGVVQVATDDSVRLCRIWSSDAAPPAARSGLLLVCGTAVRGQAGTPCAYPGWGSPNSRYQPGLGAGFFGGGMTRALSNPWIVGGVAAAAIAIPIAALNDDDDAS